MRTHDDEDRDRPEDIADESIDFEELGIFPDQPCTYPPGSEEKVLYLTARYESGAELWHPEDNYYHGPSDRAYRNALMAPPALLDDDPEPEEEF